MRLWPAVAAILAAPLLARCGAEPAGDGPPRQAAEAALRLFALAGRTDPGDADLLDILDAGLFRQDRVGALEIVASLRGATRPRVVAEVPLPDLDRVALDVSAVLRGGAARYGFQAERQPDGTWRLVSIETPGRDWPARPSRGTGLTVSPPAGEADR